MGQISVQLVAVIHLCPIFAFTLISPQCDQYWLWSSFPSSWNIELGSNESSCWQDSLDPFSKGLVVLCKVTSFDLPWSKLWQSCSNWGICFSIGWVEPLWEGDLFLVFTMRGTIRAGEGERDHIGIAFIERRWEPRYCLLLWKSINRSGADETWDIIGVQHNICFLPSGLCLVQGFSQGYVWY